MALTARTESGLKEVLESIGGAGDGHVVLAADLLAEGAPGRLVESIKEIGPIDMVVHVLGGALGMSDPLCDIEDWRKVWRLNIEVAVELNALLIPGMRKRGWGRNCAHLLGFGRREPWSSALLRREGGAQRVYAESRPHLRCRRRRDQRCGARRGYEPGGLLGHCAEGGLFPGQEIRGKEPSDGRLFELMVARASACSTRCWRRIVRRCAVRGMCISPRVRRPARARCPAKSCWAGARWLSRGRGFGRRT